MACYMNAMFSLFIGISYLIGPYNVGPNSALFLRIALKKAGVRGVGVIRAILKS